MHPDISLPEPVNYQQPEIRDHLLDIRPLNPPSKDSYNDIFTPPDFLA